MTETFTEIKTQTPHLVSQPTLLSLPALSLDQGISTCIPVSKLMDHMAGEAEQF